MRRAVCRCRRGIGGEFDTRGPPPALTADQSNAGDRDVLRRQRDRIDRRSPPTEAPTM